MKAVFRFEKEEESAVDEILDEDPISRLSITKRGSESLGLEGDDMVLVIEGEEEICKEAKEKIEEHAEEMGEEGEEEVLEAVEEEEEKSMKGFGSIFGE